MKLAEQLTRFYLELKPPPLPVGFEILHPQKDPEVIRITKVFFHQYYSDSNPRKLILGINPGRYGAGVTGINFTAPRQLKENCGISHTWDNSSELSAEFIYQMIESFGGPASFYGKYFLGSVSPLGFTSQGKNVNYYDDKELLQSVTPFIIKSIRQQLAMGMQADTCYCIGEEKNLRFLTGLNEQFGFFKEIIGLPHPRFIMQYKRKKLQDYIQSYLGILR